MPRKRKPARLFRRPGALTACQKEILLFGAPILNYEDGDGFMSDADMERGWKANEQELMAEWKRHYHSAGRRPYAWWLFTMRRRPEWPLRDYWREYAELERLGKLEPGEEDAFERLMNPPAEVSDPDALAALVGHGLSSSGIDARRSAEEYDFKARWFSRRGRPDLKRFYTRLYEALTGRMSVMPPPDAEAGSPK